MNGFKNWIIAIRPKTLPAAAASSMLGVAFALENGRINIFVAISVVLISILLQICSNLANDLFDFERGVDTANRIGPTRVTQAGLISSGAMRNGIALVISFACLIGIYLTIIAGWIVPIIGTAAIVAALLYSGGPFPYGYHFLGELFVFIFFGIIAVCGSYYVLTGEVNLLVIISSFIMGFLISNILVVNNIRDINTDKETGKNTLAVLFGKKGSVIEYSLFLSLSYLSIILIISIDPSKFLILLTFLTIPFAIQVNLNIYQTEGPRLNSLLAQTAQLSFLFSLLFSIGLLIKS